MIDRRLADAPDSGAVREWCRAAEISFHRGDVEPALDYARAAFAQAPDDAEVAHFCAWLFSNAGCYAEAAAAYERLIARYPDWIDGYRHASGAFAAAGDIERAIARAVTASDGAPGNAEFALHAGGLLLDAGRTVAALHYLQRAVAASPDEPRALRGLSAASWALGRPDEALALALHAAALAPETPDIALHAGELLLRSGRIDEALALLRAVLVDHPTDPTLWRLVSTAEAQRGATDKALAAIDEALRAAPDEAEYHLHRGHLFYRQGDFAAAAEAVNRAAALDPESRATRRAELDLLVAGGDLAGATAKGGELLRAFPEDDASAEAVLGVLNRRLDTIDGDYVVVGDRSRRLRAAHAAPGFGERLRRQARIVHALIIRETRTRFGDSRLGYGWALIEPILHIVLLSAVFSALMHGTPPIGTHFFVFYYTGLVRYSGANGTNPTFMRSGWLQSMIWYAKSASAYWDC